MNKRSLIIFISIAISLGIFAIYFIYLRPLVKLAYIDQAPGWFNQLIQSLYPRFFVEKHRFDLTFFLEKTDQIVARTFFVGFIITLFSFLIRTKSNAFNWWNSLWSGTTSKDNINALRILFFISLIIIFKDIYWDLMAISKAKMFYKPILLFNIMGIGFPSDHFILFTYLLYIIFLILGILNIIPIPSSIISIVLFIYFQGIIFGFEKTDHGFAPITYAGMIFPFLLWSMKKEKGHLVEAWSLTLIKVLIALCYFLSGLEKIFISKFHWLSPETFKAYLILHETPLGLALSHNTFLCTLLPSLTILFQLGFITILLKDNLKYLFLPIGIVFHISTYFLFDVGGFTNPWMLSYLFFFDWTQPIQKAKSFLRIN